MSLNPEERSEEPASSIGHTNRGKWADKGVPHKGWNCIEIEDLGEPSAICEMCESVEIRYAHEMQHPNYSVTLRVGCVCAEHMEEDYVAPKAREKRLRAQTRRRLSWKRRIWRSAYSGQCYVNTDGYSVAIFQTGQPNQGWKVAVMHRRSGRRQEGKKIYPTEDAARAAGFEALLWAKNHLATSEWMIKRLRTKL